MHGAGLANLIYCRKNTIVIEIVHDILNKKYDWYFKSNENDIEGIARDHFYKIAKINKLHHFFYFCIDNNLNNITIKDNLKLKKLTTTDLTIDMKVFSNFFINNF